MSIDPKSRLHLIAVPFLGTEEGEALLVDTTTFRACWNNRRELKGVTFTSLVQSSDAGAPPEAKDGTNLEAFKVVLREHDRDDNFIDAAVATLFLIDEARLHHDAENRKGGQTLSQGDILITLENEGATEEQLDLVEKEPLMRDGLRAYAKFAVNLRFPKNEDDLARTWADLGDDKAGWEGIRTESLSYDADNSWASAKDDVSRKEAGATEIEIKTLKVEQIPDADDEHDVVPPVVARTTAAAGSAPVFVIPPPEPRAAWVEEVARQAEAQRLRDEKVVRKAHDDRARSEYLLELIGVRVYLILDLPEDEQDAPLEELLEGVITPFSEPWDQREVDGEIYQLDPGDAGVACGMIRNLLAGGSRRRQAIRALGRPEGNTLYLLDTITDRGLDPETVDFNLLREREEAERTRIEEERRAEEARLEAERLAAEEAEKAAAEAASKAATPPAGPTPP